MEYSKNLKFVKKIKIIPKIKKARLTIVRTNIALPNKTSICDMFLLAFIKKTCSEPNPEKRANKEQIVIM
jgi:hypothetical protein